MTASVQVALALCSVVVLLGLMAVVRHVARRFDIGAEMQRKLVHIGTGLYALGLPWLFPDRWPIYMLVALTLAVMMVLRLPNSRLGGTLHGVQRQSYGDLLLAVAVGLCLFMAGDALYLYVLPIAVLTLADAAAALAGSSYGRRIFTVENGEKSVEGSVVFFTVTLLISMICLMLMTPFAPLNIIVISVMVAAFGTLVEAASWRGFDNLFLPMGLSIFLSVHAQNPLDELLVLAVLFAVSVVAFRMIAPKIGLTNHVARVYVTAVFLLLASTAFQNALAPILVLVAHAWCRNAAPCDAAFPDLDIVAGLALVSFGWLTLGTALGWNAVSFYGLTALGLIAALCALAVERHEIVVRFAGLAAVIFGLYLLRVVALLLNPDAANWNGPMWPILASCIGICVIVPSVAPHLFAQARVVKLTGLALVFPVASYAIAVGRVI